MKIRRRSIMASTDKDYASLRGMDFKKARDILTKDGFHEHEYGDKDDNNGYAVYRKGDKEVELTYEWVEGKRKGEAHAGKVTNVYVDDNINSSCGKKSVKASTDDDYISPNPDVIAVLEDNGFEYAYQPTPWWDKFMWFGFGCTYNDDTKEAYVWWNPQGNLYELPFNYEINSVADASAMCDDLYDWDEYNIDELLNAGLPLIGATSHNGNLDEWDYDNGMGDVAYINTSTNTGYVIDAYGDETEYTNMQDLLEAAGIIS